jgi:hypothetical protein
MPEAIEEALENVRRNGTVDLEVHRIQEVILRQEFHDGMSGDWIDFPMEMEIEISHES